MPTRLFWLLFIALLPVCGLNCVAEEVSDPLLGMHMDEVLKELGAPSSKIEKEVSREDIWSYDEVGTVLFRNGKVFQVDRKKALVYVAPAREEDEDLDFLNQGGEQEAADMIAVEEILEEIMGTESEDEPSKPGPGGVRPIRKVR